MADAELDFSALLDEIEYIEYEAEEIARRAYPLVEEYAKKVEKEWRANARKTAGRHGRHYPNSITSEQLYSTSGPEWEIGPDRAKKQGSMGRGFEYGSVKQPPHLDGARAVEKVGPEFNAAVDKLMKDFL
ncbi:hypothetical protein ACIBG7_15210 [Nonomuraea sp. NPDC050328]|uniref:hypothetical protein n=1 Tax=Nonomuraea sp. NPDC050328 TaxID=3364361 RepID=UPI0037B8403B